ncbi:kinase-like domain-containing protein [Syncephalastrum racemosum]|uniref:Kinase-like domain-containing protein n=1 Tax=Syncephalastrum racemosum TaxID=13706 RepID=A0A1X2HWH9_SYNRA|nr:kinase-like domain-containing protein [Syncephalastrum racemosum]
MIEDMTMVDLNMMSFQSHRHRTRNQLKRMLPAQPDLSLDLSSTRKITPAIPDITSGLQSSASSSATPPLLPSDMFDETTWDMLSPFPGSPTLLDEDFDLFDRSFAFDSPLISTNEYEDDGDEEEDDTEEDVYSIDDFPLRVKPKRLTLSRVLGDGNVGRVALGVYNNQKVACKYCLPGVDPDIFNSSLARELTFAAELSSCRYVNHYLAAFKCKSRLIRVAGALAPNNETCLSTPSKRRHWFVLQKFYENSDLRDYIINKENNGIRLHPLEVIQLALSLFYCLEDIHNSDVGVVDLKAENFLVDTTGNTYLTDFGSCVRMKGLNYISLSNQDVHWTSEVAPPEMLVGDLFCKKSDVFMAAWTVAEVLTPHLNDTEFMERVLLRSEDKSVTFIEAEIHPMYGPLVNVFRQCFDAQPDFRPSVPDIIRSLEGLRASYWANSVSTLEQTYISS